MLRLTSDSAHKSSFNTSKVNPFSNANPMGNVLVVVVVVVVVMVALAGGTREDGDDDDGGREDNDIGGHETRAI